MSERVDVQATIKSASITTARAAGALVASRVRRVASKAELKKIADELERVAKDLHQLCSVV